MGKVSGNWITGAHSGRACKNDDIYTKVNKKTGACYSVKLCNPSEKKTQLQIDTRTAFQAISSAISAWIKTQREASSPSEDFTTVQKAFNRQNKYSTLRGYMFSKGMYKVNMQGDVEIDITAHANFKTMVAVLGSGE